MPEMDGITEAKQILSHQKILQAKNPSLPSVHFVFVSAFSDEAIIQKCIDEIGTTDYLTKPVALNMVAPVISKIFGISLESAKRQ